MGQYTFRLSILPPSTNCICPDFLLLPSLTLLVFPHRQKRRGSKKWFIGECEMDSFILSTFLRALTVIPSLYWLILLTFSTYIKKKISFMNKTVNEGCPDVLLLPSLILLVFPHMQKRRDSKTWYEGECEMDTFILNICTCPACFALPLLTLSFYLFLLFWYKENNGLQTKHISTCPSCLPLPLLTLSFCIFFSST